MTHTDEQAAAIARRYALYAACVELIPIPLLGFAAIAAIQATMLAEIGALYGVPFNAARALVIASALAGSVVAAWAGYGLAGSLVKAVPLVGTALGAVCAPVVAFLVTRGLARAFVGWRKRRLPPA